MSVLVVSVYVVVAQSEFFYTTHLLYKYLCENVYYRVFIVIMLRCAVQLYLIVIRC